MVQQFPTPPLALVITSEREIEEVGLAAQSAGRQVQRSLVQGMKNAGRSMQAAGRSISQAGQSLTTGVTIPLPWLMGVLGGGGGAGWGLGAGEDVRGVARVCFAASALTRPRANTRGLTAELKRRN